MKRILSTLICLGLFIYSISQTLDLKTNGYTLKFTKIDTLFYSEYSTSSAIKSNTKKNDLNAVNLKYSFGKISKIKPDSLNDIPSFTTSYYVYQDGTLEAPTSQLFFKPIDIISFKKNYSNIGIIEEHPSLKGYYYLYVTNRHYNTGASIFELCNKIYSEKSVLTIEPVFAKQLKQQNPLRPWEWNVRNNANVAGGIIGADMKVENAWCNSTGTGVRIAVIDDGVDLMHPDLQANLLPGFDATGNNSGGAPVATNGHGTNCAGIIASIDNLIGTIGVAFNSRIIPIRMGIVDPITGNFNTNNIWIANCFAEAVNRGADVISNSWGGGSPSTEIDAAIQNAVANGRNGIGCVVLFAAGNHNNVVEYPATNTNVIAVGASTPCDTRKRSSNNPAQVNPGVSTDIEGTSCDGEAWWGSNFGTGLDVLAPGVLIRTTDNVGANGFVAGDYNDHFNGTSSACPSTAGVVALILAANPNLTGVQARNILEETCFKIPNGNFQTNVAGQPNGTWSNQAGYGRIDANRAVRMALGLADFTIVGGDRLCNSGIYTVANMPTGSTVAWNVSNPSIVTVTPIGNKASLSTSYANGTFTLTASVNTGCGQPTILNKTINIGPVSLSLYSVAGAATVYASAGYSYSLTYPWNIATPANIFWRLPTGWTIVNGQGTANINVWTGSTGGAVQVDFNNTCGQATGIYKTVAIGGGGPDPAFTDPGAGYSLKVFPNPANSSATITLVQDNRKAKIGGYAIREIKIMDKMGNMRLHYRFNNGRLSENMDVSELPPDIYTISVFDGQSWKQLKLSVQ